MLGQLLIGHVVGDYFFKRLGWLITRQNQAYLGGLPQACTAWCMQLR